MDTQQDIAQATSAREKIFWIESELIKRRDKQTARKFMDNVSLYASMNKEPDYGDDEFMQKVWDKAKRILDEDKASICNVEGEPKYEDFKKFLDSLQAIDRAKLEKLAGAADIDPDELERFFSSDFGRLFTEDSYVELLEEGETNYQDYLEFLDEGLTANESEIALDLYRNAKACLDSAKKHGKEFTFDEMLQNWIELQEYSKAKDWDAWRRQLNKMYGTKEEREAFARRQAEQNH